MFKNELCRTAAVSACLLLLPLFSIAAVLYSRTPSGSSINNPVTLNFSFDDFVGDLNQENLDGSLFYKLRIASETEDFDFDGIYPISQKTFSGSISLPLGNYIQAEVHGFADPDGISELGSYILEGFGDGTTPIFNITDEVCCQSQAQSSGATTGTQSSSQQFRPEIHIYKPAEGDDVGYKSEIKYVSSDQNNLRGVEPVRFGLTASPTSLFFTDWPDIVLDGRLIDDKYKNLIAKNLPAEGMFLWDTKDLADGNQYRIIGNSVDIVGEIGQFITGLFSIDHQSPTFKISAEPAVTRGENVKLLIESQEKLEEPPTLSVTQRNYIKINVPLHASTTDKGDVYAGVYEVRPGYDGPAVVEISGRDKAGNIGDVVLTGRTFSVGLEPPPKPIIIFPLDNDVVSDGKISIKGQIREDTDAVLIVNGKDEFIAKPDGAGIFLFENIPLEISLNKGKNLLNISSRDHAGNISESTAINMKFNSAPSIFIIAPAKDDIVSASTTAKIISEDKNSDDLLFTYFLAEAGTNSSPIKKLLAENTPKKSLVFNTREYPDGMYYLEVIADDGFEKISVNSGIFKISNFLPLITFDGGGKIVTNKKDIVLTGTIKSPSEAIERFKINTAEYSLDDGNTWKSADPIDGAFDDFDETFSVRLSNLSEGKYLMLFRARDSRTYFGRSEKTIIIDFAPPAAPDIAEPKTNSVLSNESDLEPEIAGVQFEVIGRTEANSEVSVVVGKGEFIGKADANGDFKVLSTLREHGKNDLKIIVTDLAGNKSPVLNQSVIYNNQPTLKFLNPREGRGVGKNAEVRWEARDLDLDTVSGVNLSYSKGGSEFKTLARNLKSGKFLWNTSGLPEGSDYQLKLEATDGVSPAFLTINFPIDNTSPVLFADAPPKTVFTKTVDLKIKGTAEDSLSGIEFVEFSLDGADWYRALITSGYLKKSATYSLSRTFVLDDGKYELQIRAVDGAGNESAISHSKFIVDTKPPRIGSFVLSSGTFSLFSDTNGKYSGTTGANLKFTLSLEEDTAESQLYVGDDKINLIKNKSSNLWEANLDFPKEGIFTFRVTAKDAVGNIANRKEIGWIDINSPGTIKGLDGKLLSGAKLNILIFNDDNKSWVRWQSEEFGKKNPEISDDKGNYAMLLPEGIFQLLIERAGFVRVRSSEFELENPTFINFDFILQPRTGIKGFIEDLIEKISI